MNNPIKETSNFIGNNNIEEFMLNSINANKLHHAYLLSGIKGLGKATLLIGAQNIFFQIL